MCDSFVKRNGMRFPCGKCKSCRINRKREWQARLLLEAATAAFSAFITLTIGVDDAKDDQYCTYLCPRHLELFWKRLRKAFPGVSIRYLAVGEYGEKRGRAHYHALVFSSHFLREDVVSRAWALGAVHFGDVQQESIDYCLAYVLKSSSELDRLEPFDALRRTRHPEFRRHSQGLGRAALPNLCIADRETGELVLQREFRVLGRTWPIGRYFRQKHRGASVTELHESGQSDPVSESRTAAIERLLHEELRSVPFGTPAYEEAKEKIIEHRAKELKAAQGRRIRDYYRNLHQHSDRGRKNETF